ncbi:hypothetical protein MMC20_006022 [Loxospora ochrophaea]|nr:hypothetical protein [Loxospora ochrophaea]
MPTAGYFMAPTKNPNSKFSSAASYTSSSRTSESSPPSYQESATEKGSKAAGTAKETTFWKAMTKGLPPKYPRSK